MFVWLSLFLYSNRQPSNRMRGCCILRRMLGRVVSLLRRMPSRTRDSSIEPPGIFSTYRLMSTVLWPFSSAATVRTAWSARRHMRSPAGDKLGANQGLNERKHFVVRRRVDRNRYLFDDVQRLLESLVVRRYDHDGVDVMLKLSERLREDFTSYSRGKRDATGREHGRLPRMITLVVPSPHGNTILREIYVAHPAAKNMIELSRTQDKEGTS